MNAFIQGEEPPNGIIFASFFGENWWYIKARDFNDRGFQILSQPEMKNESYTKPHTSSCERWWFSRLQQAKGAFDMFQWVSIISSNMILQLVELEGYNHESNLNSMPLRTFRNSTMNQPDNHPIGYIYIYISMKPRKQVHKELFHIAVVIIIKYYN